MKSPTLQHDAESAESNWPWTSQQTNLLTNLGKKDVSKFTIWHTFNFMVWRLYGLNYGFVFIWSCLLFLCMFSSHTVGFPPRSSKPRSQPAQRRDRNFYCKTLWALPALAGSTSWWNPSFMITLLPLFLSAIFFVNTSTRWGQPRSRCWPLVLVKK